MFLIENLHQKATDSGLNEDALIPQKSKKEKQIYKMATQRPQSAMTVTQKDSKRRLETTNVLQQSFYGGMSMLDAEELQDERYKEIESKI